MRGVKFRDHNWKPLASNDPSTSTIGWTIQFGGTATSDGDILTVTGALESDVKKSVPGSLSTTTYPYIVVRVNTGTYALGPNVVQANYSDSTQDQFTITTKPNTWQTATFKMTSGKTLSSIELILTDSVSSKIGYWDYVAVCSNTPIQISQTDLINGTVTLMGGFGTNHAELRLNNSRGRYTVGGSGSGAMGFGDHLHIYLGQGSTLFHRYGGYVESQEPFQPGDDIFINSRGFGLGLQQALRQNIYLTSSPQTIINDLVDTVNSANKDGVGIASNYQLTRSFVQNIGSSIPLYVSSFLNPWAIMREIGDLTSVQGTPAVFFVDAAENVHLVPLGAQGSANWTTDPLPASYGSNLTLGTNMAMFQLRRDVQSLKNRVHYVGVAQVPGNYDGWTEYSTDAAVQANWGTERIASGTTANLFHSTVSALGLYSVQGQLVMSNTNAQGSFFYPAAKNLGLNLTALGSSKNSPPLFDFYLRFNFNLQPAEGITTVLNNPDKIFFATDSSNRFEYALVGDGGSNPISNLSILNLAANNALNKDYWYHVVLPIGPNGGSVFTNPPILNTVATATFTGSSQFQLSQVGSPSWSNINYIGFTYNGALQGTDMAHQDTFNFYMDGWRILGSYYALAYDFRTSPPRYPDMREIYFYDPVSKDPAAITNFAKAELLRLRNPIIRGTITTPLLADLWPEQQVKCTNVSGNLSSTFLRVGQTVDRFSKSGFLTEIQVNDDFVNSQTLDKFRVSNVLMGMGDNAVFSREVYDIKTALLDSGFSPVLVAVN